MTSSDRKAGPPTPAAASTASVPSPTPASNNASRPSAPSPLACLRKAHPAEILLPRTRAWLDSIPAAVRPNQLAQRFPRVANQLAACWTSRAEWAQELDGLLSDKRGGRRGFPAEIVTELQKLKHWHRTLTGSVDDHWHG